MAVHIRLARQGSKKSPFYRVVATDSRSPRDGRFLEHIGVYDPTRVPEVVRFNDARLDHWLQHGAVPSATVGELIKKTRKAAAAAAAAK